MTALPDLRRLMRAACLRVGQMLNQTDLNLLEMSDQLVRIPAYAVNCTKRLIKTPRLYWADTGLALHLSGDEPGGAHLENLVLGDLLA